LLGDDAPTNAAILRGILDGTVNSAKRDVVLLNAGAALVAAGKAASLKQGIALAAETIDSGAALRKLDALVEFSQSYVQ
jgi:anthranilate phosphoribosyltransferase